MRNPVYGNYRLVVAIAVSKVQNRYPGAIYGGIQAYRPYFTLYDPAAIEPFNQGFYNV